MARYAEFKRDISGGKVAGAYYFHGEEAYLQEEALKTLNNTLTGGSPAQVFWGKELSFAEFSAAMNSPTLFAERSLALVKQAGRIKAALRQQLADCLPRLKSAGPENPVIVVFVNPEKLRKDEIARDVLISAVAKTGEVVEFAKLYENEMAEFAVKSAREMKKELSFEAARRLVDLSGSDLYSLSNEIRKLSLYHPENKEISVEDVETCSGLGKQETVYRLSEALLSGNIALSLATTEELLEQGEEPPKIINEIYRTYSRAALAKYYTAECGLDGPAVIGKLRMHPYFGRPFLKSIAGISRDDIEKRLVQIQNTDMAIKSGKTADARDGIRGMLLFLCGGSEKPH